MKFSFIRFFREELAKTHHAEALIKSIRSGYINLELLMESNSLKKLAVDAGYEPTRGGCFGFLDSKANSCPEFIITEHGIGYDDWGCNAFDEYWLVLTKEAQALLPKYIPELAR